MEEIFPAQEQFLFSLCKYNWIKQSRINPSMCLRAIWSADIISRRQLTYLILMTYVFIITVIN